MTAKRRSAAISRTYRLATSTDELFAIYPARTFLLRLSRSAGGGPALTAVELAIGILTVRVPIPTTCGRAGLSSASQYGIYVRLLLAVVLMLVVAGSARRRRVGGGASSWDSASVSFSTLTAGRLLLKSVILSAFLTAPGDGVAPTGDDITLVECLVAAAAAAGREPNRP